MIRLLRREDFTAWAAGRAAGVPWHQPLPGGEAGCGARCWRGSLTTALRPASFERPRPHVLAIDPLGDRFWHALGQVARFPAAVNDSPALEALLDDETSR